MSRRTGCQISAAATATQQADPSFLPHFPFFQNKSCYELLYLLCLPLKSSYSFTYHFPWICSYPEFSPCISHAFATQLCSSLAHFLWLCVRFAPPKLQFWLEGPVCGRRISLSIRKSKTLTSHRPEGEWDATVHIQPAVNVICSAGKPQRVQMSMSESWGGVFFAVKTLSGSTDLMQPEHFCKKCLHCCKGFSGNMAWGSSLWNKGRLVCQGVKDLVSSPLPPEVGTNLHPMYCE